MTPAKKLIAILSLSYKQQDLPDDLEENIAHCFSKEQKKFKQQQSLKKSKKAGFSFLGIFGLFFLLVNVVPSVASATSQWPVIGNLVTLMTINTHQVASTNQTADIATAKIKSTSPLAKQLNTKYLDQANEEYAAFTDEVGDNPSAYFSLHSEYKKLTDDSRFLVVEHTVTRTKGNSYSIKTYDTVDKNNDVLLSLPLLFKNDNFIKLISNEIAKQIKSPNGSVQSGYWTKIDKSIEVEPFKAIAADQKFYINSKHQLVIVFDQYDIGAGYLGSPQFVIPTEIIQKDLVDSDYLL